MARFVFQLSSNVRFEVRRAVENELIMLKGRCEMNRVNFNMEPTGYEIRKMEELENIIQELSKAKDIIIYPDEEVSPPLDYVI